MIDALVIVAIVGCAALAVLGLALTIANRTPNRALRLAVTAVVVLLAVQAVLGAVPVLSGGVTLPETSTFLIYLVVSVLVLPIGLQFASTEPTRWGGTVVAAAAIGTAVAVIRIQQLWNAGG